MDEIRIVGTPNITLRCEGIHGDLATSAIMVNAIPRVVRGEPGLKTMIDLLGPFCFDGSAIMKDFVQD